jgi:hypothetical protein
LIDGHRDAASATSDNPRARRHSRRKASQGDAPQTLYFRTVNYFQVVFALYDTEPMAKP